MRGSYYDGNTKVALGGDSAKISASGLALSFGGDWKFNEWVGLRFEFEDLLATKDFANDENVQVLSIGLVFEFPTHPAPLRSPPTPREDRSIGYVSPAAMVAPAAPATAAAPIQPPAAVSSPSASSDGGKALKTQPRRASETQLMVPGGVLLQPRGQMSNPEGDWIFVEYGGQTGWILENAR